MTKSRVVYKVNAHPVSRKAVPEQKAVLDRDGIAFRLAVGAAPQAKRDQKAAQNTESLRELGTRANSGRVDPIAMLGVQAKASASAVAPTKAQIIAESDGPEPTVMGYLKAFRKLNQ
jgi:hypothetical protein